MVDETVSTVEIVVIGVVGIDIDIVPTEVLSVGTVVVVWLILAY